MSARERLVTALTEAFLGGPWNLTQLVFRAQSAFAVDRQRTWLTSLAQSVLMTFPATAPRPTKRSLHGFINSKLKIEKSERGKGATQLTNPRPKWTLSMCPAEGPPSEWSVPALTSATELADWLGIQLGELDWFADRRDWTGDCSDSRVCHYHRLWIPKPSGGVRLLETPKARLKQIQRLILHGILDQVPIHHAAHAFRTGRSIVSHVTPHADQDVILHLDLREFFPSIQASQVNAIFRTLGYPEQVASLLTGLVTCSTPSKVLEQGFPRYSDGARWHRYRSAHLPQGAPTSPALANLCAYRLDTRLSGLARVTSAQYTRYADDIVFSGNHRLRKSLSRLKTLICAIIVNEGFGIRARKTYVMVRGNRQQISGIRVNRHPNIPRETFDELKAILHNCVRFGPNSQNRSGLIHFREHLAGRLAYWSSVCPNRISKLQQIFQQIVWPDH